MSFLLREAEKLICAVIFAGMTLLGFVNVVVRYATSYSLASTEEILTNGFLLLTVFGAAVAARKGDHLAVTLIYERVPQPLRKAMLIFATLMSAVLLALTVMAADRDVIVSRSQAVEIGGRFRVPDVMRQSGARLVEVGTTNRTYLSDYEEAIGPETALLMRVHRSNFALTGFVQDVDLPNLVALGRRYGIPVLDDLGSGALIPTEQFGLAHEPMVQESIAAGASIVCFSGDKLLGGPQAGLIVGEEAVIAALRKHPMMRSLRLDKMALGALQTTLSLYLRGEATEKVPIWRMIGMGADELRERVEAWRRALLQDGIACHMVETYSMIGGGSLPGQSLPTVALAIGRDELPDGTRGEDALAAFAARLRLADPPVVGRVEDDALLLDPRTVLPHQDDALLSAVRRAFLEDAGVPTVQEGKE